MYRLEDLLYLMGRLRKPETGCPWDLKQTYETIVPHTLEEAYEVADAIERGSKDELKDELGDLLFQVIFYSQLGQEEGAFSFDDVVDNVVTKLVRRHPHVFPEGDLKAEFPEGTSFTDEEIKGQWESIKANERRLKKESLGKPDAKMKSVLDDIPVNLPSLNRAEKLQKRAAQHGFDWPELEQVFDKLHEEIDELRDELKLAQDKGLREPLVHKRLTDEMGDVLFCCVNLSRFLKVNSDEAMRSTNKKFVERFQYIERVLESQGETLDESSLDKLDSLWNEAKDV